MILIKYFKNSILLSGPNRTSERPSYSFSLLQSYFVMQVLLNVMLLIFIILMVSLNFKLGYSYCARVLGHDHTFWPQCCQQNTHFCIKNMNCGSNSFLIALEYEQTKIRKIKFLWFFTQLTPVTTHNVRKSRNMIREKKGLHFFDMWY